MASLERPETPATSHSSASPEESGAAGSEPKTAPAKKSPAAAPAKKTTAKKTAAKKTAAKVSSGKAPVANGPGAKVPAKKVPAKKSANSDASAQTHAAPVAAFFDLDGTLIRGSANIPFAAAAFKIGMVSKRQLFQDFRHGVSFMLRGATDERSAQVRERILAAVAGFPQVEVAKLGDAFMDKLVDSTRPAMREVLDEHGRQGHDRIVLSASPTEIVSRFADESGLELGIGTTSEVDEEGRYTGKLAGPFCYKEGKVEVMEQLVAERGYDLSQCWAYSDSISDQPMLEAVGHPVAVNPEPELRAMATERGWEIIETSSVPREHITSVRGVAALATNYARLGVSQAARGVKTLSDKVGSSSPDDAAESSATRLV